MRQSAPALTGTVRITCGVTASLLAALSPVTGWAQATPQPSSGAAQPAAATAPHIPPNFDPCGGPLELLNKIGNQTPCVFVAGEAAISAQYGTAYVPVNSQINVNLPSGSRVANLSTAARAFGLPASTVYIGVLPRAEIIFTPPSFVQVNSLGPSRVLGNSPVVAGATDMTFQYKQLAYVNMKTFSLLGFDVAYHAPSGSPTLRAPGPSYSFTPLYLQPLPHNFGLMLTLPLSNVTVADHSTSETLRGWRLAPEALPYWESRGGTLLALLLEHNFQPNVTPVVFSAGQLFGRHFELEAAYGGFSRTVTTTAPFQGVVSATTTASPSLFTIGVNYVVGTSDLPAALQQ